MSDAKEVPSDVDGAACPSRCFADCIVDALSGQNHTEVELADKYGISIEDVEQIMIDAGYERCESCDYWFEASETLGDNDEPLYTCKQCR